jgi:hypothetical protein
MVKNLEHYELFLTATPILLFKVLFHRLDSLRELDKCTFRNLNFEEFGICLASMR